jgi:multicomponent Na+:H+ antiporter subunit E
MKRFAIFLVSYILWLFLNWPKPGAGFDRQILYLGVAVALVVAVVFRKIVTTEISKLFSPKRWFWFLVYLPVFFYYCIKANLDVLYRVIHPDMPIKPGIVKIKTDLRSHAALTALANSITLTPGTMSVDITEDGYIYIHWIYVRSADMEEASKIIAGPFEKFIRRIFE